MLAQKQNKLMANQGYPPVIKHNSSNYSELVVDFPIKNRIGDFPNTVAMFDDTGG